MITNPTAQVQIQLKQIAQIFKDILVYVPDDQLHHLYVTIFSLREAFTDLEDKVGEKYIEYVKSVDTSGPFKEDLGTILKAERMSEAT